MRIISGEFKSRKIKFPKSRETRPMMDRVKETIFNVLGTDVQNRRVLDLFAGSGSLGIEAISRGAKSVTFVESSTVPCQIIRDNLLSLGINRAQWEILGRPVTQALRHLSNRKRRFDLIFLDPPFNRDFIKKILRLIGHFDIVELGGMVVYQRARQENLPENIPNLHLIKEKAIGQAYIGFFIAGKSYENR